MSQYPNQQGQPYQGAGQVPGGQGTPYGGYAQPHQGQSAYPQGQPNFYGQQAWQQPAYNQSMGQNAAQNMNQYPQGGYAAPVQSQPQTQAPYAATPYSGQGYQNQAYQNQGYAQQGYAQGQSQSYYANPNAQAYGGQMPYTQGTNMQQGYAQQPYQQPGYTPQTGMQGGYTDPNPKPQVQELPRESVDPEKIMTIAVPLVMIVFFAASMIFGLLPLKWLFLASAVCGLGLAWARQLYSPNTRLMMTIITLAAAVLTVITMVARPNSDPVSDASPTSETVILDRNGQAVASEGFAEQDNAGLGAWVNEPMEVTPAPTAEQVGQTTESLTSFFYFWSVNNIDNMIGYCAPSWVRSNTEPKTALFQILANRLPKSYTIGVPTGTDNDVSRSVPVTATIDKQNGRTPETYIFNIIMLKENETWYVDPRSLKSYEEAEETATSAAITQPPTPQPGDPGMVLYYNPDGGSYYHSTADCDTVAAKWRPLKGSFTFSQINEPAYKELRPCPKCAAPMRPSN
ncbi:MAG: hypothetical protein IJ083_02915 [Clostridia bacterium]|nr:hypothetical protein [Clostridia bacterium]